MKYFFDVSETFIKTIAVEAENLSQAKERLEQAYNQKKINISHKHPDDIDFKYAQKEVEECIEQGFVSSDELETI